MKNKKNHLRMCVVTKQMHPKNELLRIVKVNDNDYELDFTGKLNGRGAYVTNNLEIVEKLIKTKALNRSFKKEILNENYAKIWEQYIASREQN